MPMSSYVLQENVEFLNRRCTKSIQHIRPIFIGRVNRTTMYDLSIFRTDLFDREGLGTSL